MHYGKALNVNYTKALWCCMSVKRHMQETVGDHMAVVSVIHLI